eukprot:1953186-Prymnesium_polylepis.1
MITARPAHRDRMDTTAMARRRRETRARACRLHTPSSFVAWCWSLLLGDLLDTFAVSSAPTAAAEAAQRQS